MTPSAGAPGAVVVGGYVNALSVVRALAPLGLPVAVVTTAKFDIAHRSRWATERADLTGARDFEEALAGLLARNVDRWRGRVVFPTHDAALLALAARRDDLRDYRVVAPGLSVATAALHKDATDEHARAVGIDTPATHGIADAAICARRDLRFPVVVKPIESEPFFRRFGCKLFFVRDHGELEQAVRRIETAGVAARVLDYVPGGDDAFYNYCVYVDARGQVLAGLGMHKLRKSPPFFGVCRVAEPWPDDRLREPTVALLRRIGYHGMANAEYKRDPRDGKMRLMEVNCRPFLMAGLARRAGVDLVRLAWAEATQTPYPPAEYNGWRGHWIHLHADLLYALLFHRAEGLRFGDYLKPYFGSVELAVWSRSDPAPFVAQWSRTLADAAAMVVSRQRRTSLRASVQPPHLGRT